GWVRASSRTIAALVQTRDTFDLGSPVLEQLATGWLLDNAASFLPDRRQLLSQRRDLCCELMHAHFPEWRFRQPQGGLSFWVELPDTLATLFATRAESEGIQLGTGTRFGLAGAFDRFLRMPFTLPDETLRSAFQTLQPIWDNLRSQNSAGKIRKII
ncbi:PLP-dependent aminotransferase family protein, partial [Citrobacter koseri]